MWLNSFWCPSSNFAWSVQRYRANTVSSRSHSDESGAALLLCSSGVWPLASRARHSCSGTALRSFIGDVLILRAAMNLAAGDELTFPHIAIHQYDSDDVLALLNEQLRARLGISDCRCALRLDRRATPTSICLRRRAMLEDITFHLDNRAQGLRRSNQ